MLKASGRQQSSASGAHCVGALLLVQLRSLAPVKEDALISHPLTHSLAHSLNHSLTQSFFHFVKLPVSCMCMLRDLSACYGIPLSALDGNDLFSDAFPKK